MQRFKAFLPAAAAALILTACGGGKIPATRYYKLALPAASAPAPERLGSSVVVMPVTASEMLTQDRIVYRPTREEVGYYDYHRWAEDPRTTVRAGLIDRLLAQGSFRTAAPFDGRTKADYVLRVRIERLEEVDFEDGVKARAALSAELLDAEELQVVWQGSAEAERSVNSPEVRDVVSSLSAAAEEAVGKLTASLDAHMREASASASN